MQCKPQTDTSNSRRANGLVLAILATAFTAVTAVTAVTPCAAEDLNRVVLRVNNEIATLFEYEHRKSAEMTRILANPNTTTTERQEAVETVGKEVMQGMFSELLLISFADQQGIRVRDAEVEEALERMKQQQGIETRAQLEEALGTFGMTYDDLWENTRRDLLWNQVVGREVNSRIKIGDEELRAYYRNNLDKFQVPEKRHLEEIIVLETSGLGTDALQAKAVEIAARLNAGEAFETVAEEGKESGLTTGVIDLGWLQKEELEEVLAEASWSLAEGEFSTPTAGRGGLHILHVVEAEEATVQPFADVEPLIARNERSQRFAKELRTFIKEIEHESYIVENLPPEAVGYRNLVEDFETEQDLEIFRSPVVRGQGEDDEPVVEAAPEAGEG